MQDNGLPTADCPVTKRPVVLIAAIWGAKEPSRVNCPSCGQEHLWHPAARELIDTPDEPRA